MLGASRRTTAAVVVAVGLVLGTFAAPATSAAPARPDAPAQAEPAQPEQEAGGGSSVKAEYDEISRQEAELLIKIDTSQKEQERLAGELVELQGEVLAKRNELLLSQIELTEAEKEAKSQAKKRREAEAKVVLAQDRLRQQIVASFVSGGETGGTLEAILRTDNGEEVGNAMAYSRAIVGDSDRLVHDLEVAQAARRQADKAAKSAKVSAEKRRDDVKGASQFLAAAVEQQAGLVDDVTKEVAIEKEALNEVKGRKAKIEGDIAALSRTSDGVSLFLADFQSGQPDWKPGDLLITNPMPGYQIGSKFGQRTHPILGTTRLHAGGDMGAPSGTPIYAPADGIVVLAGPRGGYGNATVIDHGFSLATLHGHQSRIDVTAGQSVKRGDQIGLVGTTGLSTGPHLHFETRLKGVPTDPELIVDFTRPTDSYPAERERLIELYTALLEQNAD